MVEKYREIIPFVWSHVSDESTVSPIFTLLYALFWTPTTEKNIWVFSCFVFDSCSLHLASELVSVFCWTFIHTLCLSKHFAEHLCILLLEIGLKTGMIHMYDHIGNLLAVKSKLGRELKEAMS